MKYWKEGKYVGSDRLLYEHPQLIYELLELSTTGHTRVGGFKCSYCGEIREIGFNGSQSKDVCNACAGLSKTKQSNNTSGYIGVFRTNNKTAGAPKDRWITRVEFRGTQTLIATYKDSEVGYDNARLYCAIDRDLYIIENNLIHTRNFSDNELKELLATHGYKLPKGV